MKIKYTIFHTRPGWMGIVVSDSGIKHIVLPRESPEAVLDLLATPVKATGHLEYSEMLRRAPDSPAFASIVDKMARFMEGETVTFNEPLDLTGGTAFQQAVWGLVKSIPWGKTETYSSVARELGKPAAARAVGQAMRRNPVPPIVPCHRVLHEDGTLGGFSSGLAMKRYLLRLEGHHSLP